MCIISSSLVQAEGARSIIQFEYIPRWRLDGWLRLLAAAALVISCRRRDPATMSTGGPPENPLRKIPKGDCIPSSTVHLRRARMLQQ